MKKNIFYLAFISLITIFSCSKSSDSKDTEGNQSGSGQIKGLPDITTLDIKDISQTSATAYGQVSDTGYSNVSKRGICYSDNNKNPTVDDGYESNYDGSIGKFYCELNYLKAGKVYYYRAFAYNDGGVSYGSVKQFKTLDAIAPTGVEVKVKELSLTTASIEGSIGFDGGADITQKGFCLSSTNTSPSIEKASKVIYIDANKSFSDEINGLDKGVKYYIRAFATNSVGTTYGDAVLFRTFNVSVGDSYQGGRVGLLLQPDYTGYIAGESHGYIVATEDQSSGIIIWGCSGKVTYDNDFNDFGEGYTKTQNILSKCTYAGSAAALCHAYTGGGYSDWFLPSFAELAFLQKNIQTMNVKFNTDAFYWTSTTGYSNQIYVLKMYYGGVMNQLNASTGLAYVRAVRKF